jgi:hypothetical protein
MTIRCYNLHKSKNYRFSQLYENAPQMPSLTYRDAV